MKASVLTLHTVANYGTQLQALATQEKLQQYFDCVEFIDYRRNDTYGLGLLKTFSKGNILKGFAVIPTLIRWKFIFGNFQKKHLNISRCKYLSEEDLRKFSDNADVYFSGSDQIWNSGWNGGIVPAFYLSFIPPEKPKYAFCSSFGRMRLSDKEVEDTKEFINQFRFISVREESGRKILLTQYNYKNCTRLVDPTLSLEPDYWRNICKKSKRIKGKYILIYNLNKSKSFDKYAKEIAKRVGLPIYRFCTRYDQILRNGKSLVIPKIEDFISLIDNAELVITDSFHATAFSMNLNTEVICVYPSAYSGRISEFLKLVKAEQRHSENYEDFDVLQPDRKTDFHQVNRILNDERKRMEQFLFHVVEEVRSE